MTEQLEPCKRCKYIPKLVEVSGLFYVQCHGMCEKKVPLKNEQGEVVGHKNIRVKCDKWQPYEFLGASRRAAIDAWNYANTHKALETED